MEASEEKKPPVVQERPYCPWAVAIHVADLEKHGYTRYCRKCRLLRNGEVGKGVPHNFGCRKRLEEALREEGNSKITAADERLSRAVEQEAQQPDFASSESLRRSRMEEAPSAPGAPSSSISRDASKDLAPEQGPQPSMPNETDEPNQQTTPPERGATRMATGSASEKTERKRLRIMPRISEADAEMEILQVEVDADDHENLLPLRGYSGELAPSRGFARKKHAYWSDYWCSPREAELKIVELYSPPRVGAYLEGHMPHLPLRAGSSFDLR